VYLAEVFAENFRLFGNGSEALSLRLQKGLNALVGENDSGKTAIIDAIRYCLWTTSQDYHRFTEDEFNCSAAGRATELTIRCKFEELSIKDQGTFFEFLTVPEGKEPALYVTLRARRLDSDRNSRVAVSTHAGDKGDGPTLEGIPRELLRTIYLRPLRDAEGELSAGRNSRLSQILSNHPDIASQATDDFDKATQSATTLVGIMHRAEHDIDRNQAVRDARDNINTNYLSSFQIGDDTLVSSVGVANDSTLNKILEKLELKLTNPSGSGDWTRRGLGYNNALFMSAELLLLGSRETCPMLLIEEPEAHMHPQLQARVIDLLITKTDDPVRPVQVLLTTHSPNIAASIPLGRVTVVSGKRAYSLSPSLTALADSDYAFLERFLDVTKSNLFFAKAVAIVEGDAENLLLPALASKVGRSFSKNGVSIVNVGHTGLLRYSNIFKRHDGTSLPIRVACLKDRDVVPDSLSNDLRGELKKESDLTPAEHVERERNMRLGDGGSVKTFISNSWTFEYDLAVASWKMAKIMHQAIQVAKGANSSWPDPAMIATTRGMAAAEVEAWQTSGRPLAEVAIDIYTPLRKGQARKPVAAQFAAKIVESSDLAEADLPTYIIAALRHLAGTV